MSYGNVLQYIEKSGEEDAIRLAIASGLEYLHKKHVVHGDLHAGNILIDAAGAVRLADFGLANFSDAGMSCSSARAGATRYMAPEILDPDRTLLSPIHHTPASDMYSFGQVSWHIYTGKIPFHNLNNYQAMSAIINGKSQERSLSDKHIPDALWHIMQLCWCFEPHRRTDALTVRSQLEAVGAAGHSDSLQPPNSGVDTPANSPRSSELALTPSDANVFNAESPSPSADESSNRHQDGSEILVSVDAILSDSGLLPTILDAFRQQDPHTPDDVIDFVLKLISHRVAATAEDVVNTYGHLPLDLLSNQDWTELSSLVVNTIKAHHLDVPPPTEAPTWLVKALALVLSPSGHELTPRRHVTVYRCFLEEQDPNHAILQNVISPAVTRSGADITTTMRLIFALIDLALRDRDRAIPAAHEPKLLDLDVLQDRTTYQPLSNIMGAAMNALKQHDKIRTARRARELTSIDNQPYSSAPTTEDVSIANSILLLFSGSSRAVPQDVRDFMYGYEISSRPLSVILDALSTAMLAPNNTENGPAAPSAAFGHPSYRVRAVLRFLSLYFKPGGLSLPLESMP
ncbi:uncharacterized protein PHACADRAFT_129332, partial [Phanerochaete carnosa HHB-10118-sp]